MMKKILNSDCGISFPLTLLALPVVRGFTDEITPVR
jgi:hypothetical protein